MRLFRKKEPRLPSPIGLSYEAWNTYREVLRERLSPEDFAKVAAAYEAMDRYDAAVRRRIAYEEEKGYR